MKLYFLESGCRERSTGGDTSGDVVVDGVPTTLALDTMVAVAETLTMHGDKSDSGDNSGDGYSR